MAYGCIALLAELVEDGLVFPQGVHAPVSGGYDDGEAQDLAEHQHERDGKSEDQERVQHKLGHGHTAPDRGQGPVERADLGEGPVCVKASEALRVVLGQN